MKKKNWIVWIAIAVMIVPVLLFSMKQFKTTSMSSLKIDGIVLPQAQGLVEFQLTASNGKPFTNQNLKGRWTMLFFGFTNCGNVCPTTMAALNRMYLLLKDELPSEKLPQVVLISVDPERDTVARLNAYVKTFNSEFIGARGTPAQTTLLEKEMHIAAAKMLSDNSGKNNYTINHTAEILLINPEGQLQAFLSYPHEPQQMARDYKQILTAKGMLSS